MRRSSVLCALALLLSTSSAWAATLGRHSGVVVMADETQITIHEMGPWHGPGTQPTAHVFRLTGNTNLVMLARTSEGRDDWPGAFSEEAVQPRDLRIGDFVTVIADPEGARPVAIQVVIVRPGNSP
jgi:hypothetical protein